MITSEKEFLHFLDRNHFTYHRMEHPAVFTCEEAALHQPDVPSVSTKNLFLCDKKKRRFFLAVTSCEKTMRLDALVSKLNIAHIRFGSENDLMRLLGVTRGSVTMMGLVNDIEHRVELWMDSEIWDGEYFQSHPLVNTATLVLARPELERFFALTGHALHFFTA